MRKRAIFATRTDTGIHNLALALLNNGHELLTGDHAGRIIASSGLPVTPVEFATQQSKVLGGRASTLHYSLHAGISGDFNDERERAALERSQIAPIDVVVAQLPQSEDELGDEPLRALTASNHAAVVALLQSATGRYERVCALVDPADFATVDACLGDSEDAVVQRRYLAIKAIQHIQAFHAVQLRLLDDRVEKVAPSATVDGDHDFVASDLSVPTGGWGMALSPTEMTGGEDSWRLYDDTAGSVAVRGSFDLVHGSAPDIDALLNLDAVLEMLDDMNRDPGAAVAVRGHVCAAASSADSAMRALLRAIGADPIAARGGALAYNGRVDSTLARALVDFEHAKGLRLIAAEAFDEQAAEMLGVEEARTLIEVPRASRGGVRAFFRPTRYGILVEPKTAALPDLERARILTKTPVDPGLLRAADLAFRVGRHCTSCSVVIADSHSTLGISTGQAHITDAIQIASVKARRANRACAAVVAQPLEPQAIPALAKAQVKLLVVNQHTADPAMLAAADAAEMAVIETPNGWQTLR